MRSFRRRLLLLFILILFAAVELANAQERFIENGDGTTTDIILGVMWAKNSNQGNITWKEAWRYCRQGPTQVFGKYANWRMPTIAELETLYIADKNYTGYETDCGQIVRSVPEVSLTCGWIWSSEVKSITARVFNFHRGYIYTDRMVHNKNYRALPVRDLSQDEKKALKIEQ